MIVVTTTIIGGEILSVCENREWKRGETETVTPTRVFDIGLGG